MAESAGPRGLTSESINELAERVIREGPGGPNAGDAKRDWRAFVGRELQLTGQQRANLARIPKAEVDKIQDALGRAVDRQGRVHIRLPEDGGEGNLLIEPGDSGTTADLTIWFLECKFYADCSGWNCRISMP